MSEYTPTTEEVRDYIRAADRVTAHMFSGAADSVEAFDRWLAAHDAEVRAAAIEAAAVIADRYATAPGRPRASVESIAAQDIAARIRRDAEVRAGVVAEDPEWEYAWEADEERRTTTNPRGPRILFDGMVYPPETLALFARGRRVRRRKAGQWVPVEQEGAE
ncbi:hypothetical protein [Streptomyces sp. AC495_CC817]|uniref:hypothetical protein n=1 Tax=Streptomyces sp. AC495_CC817 TaxID=2823900 RepID=UPI001C26B71D|nr:hypothetical protein [Streptomyces sp. AC495_CC817]